MEPNTKHNHENKKLGILRFEKNDVVFTFNTSELIRFSFNTITVIGEMTMGQGSRFLVFVAPGSKHYTIPDHSTANMAEFQAELGKRLNMKMVPSLFDDELDSYVIYPRAIAGHKIFHFITDQPRSIMGLFNKNNQGTGVHLVLRDEIKNYHTNN